MSLDDRDYMRKRRNESVVESRRSSPATGRDEEAGHVIAAFFRKYPRFFPLCGLAIAILFVVALALSGK